MKHSQQILSGLTLSLLVSGCQATDSVQDVSQGVSHIALGSSELALGSVKVVSVIAAVPLVVGGNSAKGMANLGEDILDWASGKGNEPLTITDDTLTIGPSPKAAMSEDNHAY